MRANYMNTLVTGTGNYRMHADQVCTCEPSGRSCVAAMLIRARLETYQTPRWRAYEATDATCVWSENDKPNKDQLDETHSKTRSTNYNIGSCYHPSRGGKEVDPYNLEINGSRTTSPFQRYYPWNERTTRSLGTGKCVWENLVYCMVRRKA